MTAGESNGKSAWARSRKLVGASRRSVLGAVAGLTGLILGVVWIETRKPTYEGKSVGYWIEQLTGNNPAKAR
jgi:hypothetical protein